MALSKLTYFRGRGRAETTRWMLAVTDTDFINVAIDTPEELAALRATGKLPFDQMPLLEIDGQNLSQSSAMTRYLARNHGLYGNNETDAMWCDLVAGVVADFAETAIQAPFKSSAAIAVADMEDRFAKFGPRFEARIAAQSSTFIASANMTFADVVLAEALSSYLEWCPEILTDTPHLERLYNNVISTPGVAAYLASDLRYPIPDANYVVAAARVLRRSLPAHMPDPNRFVVS
ncbi:MAG: glutathione S-transferase family protein [Pseudomonadota bacterium]